MQNATKERARFARKCLEAARALINDDTPNSKVILGFIIIAQRFLGAAEKQLPEAATYRKSKSHRRR